MKIYLNSEYKDRKKLEKAILEEFPEISVRSAKYKGGKKKATFVFKETCYKFDNRDDLLLTLKELLDYTQRKEKLGEASASADEEKILNRKSEKKSKDGKSEGKKEKGTKGKTEKDLAKKGKDKSKKEKKDEAGVRLESQTSSGKDVLVVLPEETEEHVPTLKEILKSKDYEQIDEAFYAETAFEEPDDQQDAEGSKTESYEASLPKSKEKDDDEVMSDTFGDEENLKSQSYEVEHIEETRESDLMKEMGFTDSDSDDAKGRMSYEESIPLSEGKGDLEVMEEAYDDLGKTRKVPLETEESEEELEEGAIRPDELMEELGYSGSGTDGRISYEESIPQSEGKDDVEIMEEAYDDLDKSKTGTSEAVENEEALEEGRKVAVQPDELMRELGYLEGEASKGQDQEAQEPKTQEAEGGTHRKAGSVEDRSGNRVPLSHGTNEIVLEVPVEKYNLNDLNIKIKFGHFGEPSSTYETKKKP